MRTLSARELESIAHKHGLKLIVLFGSQVTGHVRSQSDVDVAALPSRRLSWDERNELWAKLCELFQAEVDLSVLDHAQPLLMYQVAEHGQVLYESEQWAWANFKLYARRLYWDTAPLRESLSRYLNRRVEEMRHAG
jgi:predicted nucleotidyltransferase